MNGLSSDYDDFAYFYNKYWTLAAPSLMEMALETLLFPEIKPRATVLDLCCGTGDDAALLSDRGYAVTGVDASKTMLSYAKAKAPSAEFLHMDAADFKTSKKFDAALCLFDSINHINSLEDMSKVFKNVGAHLKKGAPFIFDANSLESSRNASNTDMAAADEESAFFMKAAYDEISRTITYDICSFRSDGSVWRRKDLRIVEKYYAPEEIISALNSAGFNEIRITEGADDLEIEAFEGRTFFTVWK